MYSTSIIHKKCSIEINTYLLHSETLAHIETCQKFSYEQYVPDGQYCWIHDFLNKICLLNRDHGYSATNINVTPPSYLKYENPT